MVKNVFADSVEDAAAQETSKNSPDKKDANAGQNEVARTRKKMSGEYMMTQPLIHVDECFWIGVVTYLCYLGDFWAIGFMVVDPLLVYLLIRIFSRPGDSEACNNIVPVDLRTEFSAGPDVLECIRGGKFVQATVDDRPNSEWVGCFLSSLAPDCMDYLDRKQFRLVSLLAQGGQYLPKASTMTLAMILYSVFLTGLTATQHGCFRFTKAAVILGAHINLMHIFRDHSVSGLTHHGAYNVGEWDKAEFIWDKLVTTLILTALTCLLPDWHVVLVLSMTLNLSCMAFTNHTLVHYTDKDVKGKGLSWRLVLGVQRLLASCKVLTSRDYHNTHHFHGEMSHPAILITLNEYLNSNSLRPFLTRTVDVKMFRRIEVLSNVTALAFLYMATC